MEVVNKNCAKFNPNLKNVEKNICKDWHERWHVYLANGKTNSETDKHIISTTSDIIDYRKNDYSHLVFKKLKENVDYKLIRITALRGVSAPYVNEELIFSKRFLFDNQGSLFKSIHTFKDRWKHSFD